MQKKFISSLLWMVFFNLLIKPYAIFGIDAEVQNRVGTEEYGLYFTLLNFSYIFNILLDLGITNYNTKYVAQNPNLVKRYIGNILGLRLVLVLFYTFSSLFIAYLLGYNERQMNFLYLLLVNQFIISVILFFRSYFAGLLLFKWDILLSILDRVILIVIVGTLLYFPVSKTPFQIEWFIYAQTLSFLIAMLIALALVLKRIGIPRLRWSYVFNLVILRKSIPYALLFLLMMMYTRVDAMMIERLHPHGNKQVGIYAQGFRLLDASFMFMMLFANLLFPIFSRLLREKKSVLPLLETATKLLTSFSTILVFTCYVFAFYILDLIYLHDVALVVPTFQLLMLSFIPTSIVLVYGSLLTANGELKKLNILSFLGLILNILLNYLLVPTHGSFGAAIATLATQSIVGLIYIFITIKVFSITFNHIKFLRYFGYFSSIFLTYLGTSYIQQTELRLISFVSVLLLGSILFGLIPVKEIMYSLKKEKIEL
jgi:O-antigen/teichoic acid export membrane protein